MHIEANSLKSYATCHFKPRQKAEEVKIVYNCGNNRLFIFQRNLSCIGCRKFKRDELLQPIKLKGSSETKSKDGKKRICRMQ